MTRFFAYTFYLVKLAILPIRFALYYLHRFTVFSTKPGARFLLPMALCLSIWAGWSWIEWAGDTFAIGYVANAEPLLGSQLYADLYPYRWIIVAAVAVLLFFLTVNIISVMIRPIVAAFPPPNRPLVPHPPFFAPQYRIKTVPVRLHVQKLAHGRFSGDLKQLDRFMPAPILELLSKPVEQPVRVQAPKLPTSAFAKQPDSTTQSGAQKKAGKPSGTASSTSVKRSKSAPPRTAPPRRAPPPTTRAAAQER